MSDDLESLSSQELHDLAVHRAKRHVDVKFFWQLMQTLPAAEAAAGELNEAETDVLRLSAHVDDVAQAGVRPTGRGGGAVAPADDGGDAGEDDRRAERDQQHPRDPRRSRDASGAVWTISR